MSRRRSESTSASTSSPARRIDPAGTDAMDGPPELARLFSPITVGGLTLRNRIVSTAHSTGFADHGRIGERLAAYYEARARGGVGLIITGSTSVHPTSTSRLLPALSSWDDAVIPGYRLLAEAVHPH